MREMKDSGIEWIGAVPVTWEIHPIYFYFSERKNKNIFGKEQNLLSLSYGHVIRKNINTVGGLLPESFNTYNIVEANDIIIRPTDLQNDKRSLRTGLCKEHGIITSAYIALKPIADVNVSYVHYLLHTYDIMKVFYNMGNGVRQGLNYLEFSKLMLFLPPMAEQSSIAEFLDKECSELNALISDIQSQIEALEEYKRSVITEAVTKGLDPDVEMRDSGYKWCPIIPKHWHKIPSKYLFVSSDIRKYPDDVLLTASQRHGIISQTEYMERENAKIVLANQGIDNWKHVEPNDFIISLRSFQGGLELSEVRGCITWHYIVLKATKPIIHKYYKWLFKSFVYIKALQGTCNFIRDGQDLRYSNFVQVPIFQPPMEEQQQIADYLDSKCAEIDSIIAEKKQQIETIEEYKKSLIFEYVTGKKEVASTLQVVTIHPALMLALVLREFGDDLKGKIHAQKAAYLSEMVLGSRPNAQYYRYEQGPYDEELDNYLKQIHKRQWFTIHNGNPMTCSKGKKYSEFEEKYKDLISKYSSEIKKIVDFLRPMRSSQAGRVATLYAVWNDFMIDGITNPTDSQLIDEVTTNWTPNKSNPDKSTWQDTLNKMKAAGIVPTGYGLHTKAKEMRHI